MTASLGGRYDPWPVKRSTDWTDWLNNGSKKVKYRQRTEQRIHRYLICTSSYARNHLTTKNVQIVHITWDISYIFKIFVLMYVLIVFRICANRCCAVARNRRATCVTWWNPSLRASLTPTVVFATMPVSRCTTSSRSRVAQFWSFSMTSLTVSARYLPVSYLSTFVLISNTLILLSLCNRAVMVPLFLVRFRSVFG